MVILPPPLDDMMVVALAPLLCSPSSFTVHLQLFFPLAPVFLPLLPPQTFDLERDMDGRVATVANFPPSTVSEQKVFILCFCPPNCPSSTHDLLRCKRKGKKRSRSRKSLVVPVLFPYETVYLAYLCISVTRSLPFFGTSTNCAQRRKVKKNLYGV